MAPEFVVNQVNANMDEAPVGNGVADGCRERFAPRLPASRDVVRVGRASTPARGNAGLEGLIVAPNRRPLLLPLHFSGSRIFDRNERKQVSITGDGGNARNATDAP